MPPRKPSLFGSLLPKALTAEFDAFWVAYPPRPHNPRAQAEEAFIAAAKHIAPADLIRAAQAYARDCVRLELEPKFLPHAATWLRQGRFRDWLHPVAPDAAQPAPAVQEIDHPLWPHLRGRVSENDFRTWFSKVRLVDNGPDGIVLIAPSKFIADRIWQDFRNAVKAAFPSGAVTWSNTHD